MKKLFLFVFLLLIFIFLLFLPGKSYAAGEACSGLGYNGTCITTGSNCPVRSLGISTCSSGEFCCASAGQETACSNTKATCYTNISVGNGCPTGWNSVGSCTQNLYPGTCCTPPPTLQTCTVNGVSGNCSNTTYGCSTYWLGGSGSGGCSGLFNMCCSVSPKADVACATTGATCYTNTGGSNGQPTCPTGYSPGTTCVSSGQSGICCTPSNCSQTGQCGTQGSYTPQCTSTTCKTAIGTIPTDPSGFLKKIFSVLLSISGVIAVLLIIISGYRLMISQGNPEGVQKAREQLTAAVIGLLFIIFSFVFLQIIGADILGLFGR